MTVSLAAHWTELATAALLGTDRRPVPPAPPGPVAEVVDRVVTAGGASAAGAFVASGALGAVDEAEQLLVQVALLAAARRGGVQPAPPVASLAPCPHDARPEISPAASARLTELLEVWPELVDEWLAAVIAAGCRLSPHSVVVLVTRYRTDAARRPRIERAAGPIVAWLADLFPAQFAPRRTPPPAVAGKPGALGPAAPGAVGAASGLAEVPLPPDLEPLLAQPARVVAASLADGLVSGRLANRHRPVLVLLLRRLPVAALPTVADALSRSATNAATLGLAMTLADLARTRHAMHAELALAGPSAPPPVDPSTRSPA